MILSSSSRSGSSLLHALLRERVPGRYLQGECNPFLRLGGLGFPSSGTGSDELRPEHAALAGAFVELATAELGQPSTTLAEDDVPFFVADVLRRLRMQWPALSFDRSEVAAASMSALRDVGWRPDGVLDVPGFHRLLLARLEPYGVDRHRYDLERARTSAVLPPAGIVEEPPFVLTVPQSRGTPVPGLVVLKSPSHAYRLSFWEALVGRGRLKVLHLVRNPAAAINGLIDGWLSDAFHSHRLSGAPLRIDGYSHLPGGRTWWKFDLSPGWAKWAEQDLTTVCGHQWAACHRAILDYTAERRRDDLSDFYLRVRFEDLVESTSSCASELKKIVRWTRAELRGGHGAGLPIVMATAPPEPGRWRRRQRKIAPVVATTTVREVAAELGYDDMTAWS